VQVEFKVPLSSRTSFGVGGPAEFWFTVEPSELQDAIGLTRRLGGPILVMGTGTNVLASDRGWLGTVIRVRLQIPRDFKSFRILQNSRIEVVVPACLLWDQLVSYCVTRQWQGLECLSGVPGTVGAAPVQNIGAYGQQVSDVVASVKAMDVNDGTVCTFTHAECEFTYRGSIFNRRENLDRYIITEVAVRLVPGGKPCRTYGDIAKITGPSASVGMVREAVLRIRRGKGMLEGQCSSAGSFFKNPTKDGKRISAAQLVEETGFPKGYARGKAGISPQHALALVNLGGATASDIVGLAREIQEGVAEKFSIVLEPEVRLVGFSEYPLM